MRVDYAKAKRALRKCSSTDESRTDELDLENDKYYRISELVKKTKTERGFWYNYTSTRKRCSRRYYIGPLDIRKNNGKVYIKGSDAKRIFKHKKTYSKKVDRVTNSTAMPDFAKGNVIEMCARVAMMSDNILSKRIWTATAIYAYYAMLNDAEEKGKGDK